ncbi:MAG: RNA polymerase sigma factor [Acidimicrobiia bacterium]
MRGVDFGDALAAAQAGEAVGFADLYREFAPGVLGFLRGRVPREAEDVAASVWLDVAQSIGRFVGDEKGFRAWLFTIVRRRMLNEFRRQGRDHSDPHDPAIMPTPTSPESPEGEVIARFEAAEALVLIGSVLPPLQADVVLMRVVAGLPVDEIAEVLDLAPGHIRVLSHRGLKTLAEHFSRDAVTHGPGSGISEVP